MMRAPTDPSLPQNDTPAQQAARNAQLAASQTKYAWTTTVATLPGVPLSAAVPSNDEPSAAWLKGLAEIGVAIVVNAILVKLSGLGGDGALATPDLAEAQARCAAISASLTLVGRELAARSPTTLVGRLEDDVEAAVATVGEDALRELLNGHIDELKSLAELTDADRAAIDGGGAPTLEAYRALFDTLALQPIAWQFEEDDVFARMRVAGPNSALIAQVTTVPAKLALTATQYASVIDGDTLEAALAAGRVYLCDYADLSVLVPGTWGDAPKYVACPIAVFAVPPGGSSLVPVAIQLGQDGTSDPLFVPSPVEGDQWGWAIAKFIVQVADGNYHELFAHLGRTHLVIEAFAVATHRHLAELHPVWALLVPHFEGTLFINDQAATSLIKSGGPIDHIFGGTIESSQAAAIAARLTFDVTAKMLTNDLAARGVADATKLPDYPYRDDALLVWGAIHDWASAYIDTYYAADSDVIADTELAAWASALAADGKLTGLPMLTTRSALADLCTMVMFTASAQHAAVNFPQKTIMAFAPSVTGASWSAPPTTQVGHDQPGWLAYMPPLSLALDQLNTLWLLGSLHYRPLGDYRSNDLPYLPWFQDPAIIGAGKALASFQAALAQVETEIVARNALRAMPYPYLQPSLIPTSINI